MSTTTRNTTATRKTRPTEHETAEALQVALNNVNEGAVPVMSRDRHIPRKEQARLARELFKQLGLKGIGVTTPSYSMASTVSISIPKLEIHCPDMWPHAHGACCRQPGGHSEETRCPACHDNQRINDKIDEILARAFPKHDDRSDSQTDYFDHCWSTH